MTAHCPRFRGRVGLTTGSLRSTVTVQGSKVYTSQVPFWRFGPTQPNLYSPPLLVTQYHSEHWSAPVRGTHFVLPQEGLAPYWVFTDYGDCPGSLTQGGSDWSRWARSQLVVFSSLGSRRAFVRLLVLEWNQGGIHPLTDHPFVDHDSPNVGSGGQVVHCIEEDFFQDRPQPPRSGSPG